MTGKRDVRVRRVYDEAGADDGTRVLVDRVWPRGLSKEAVHLDEWCKEVAPSTELRKWYGHDPDRFEEFKTRYAEELAEPGRAQAFEGLRDKAKEGRLTLLTASKAVDISQAAVLAERLR
jgi:uncharacterized protein YeaO (DUF488 family)